MRLLRPRAIHAVGRPRRPNAKLLCRWVLGFSCALITAASAFAQQDWAAVAVPTSQNLWGVCFASDRFVAVGSAGTVLTSPDGLAWAAQPSGTSEWLLAVAYGQGQYVAVGDHGTILTSQDAATWVLHSVGGPRLNGVAFGGGVFLAVGENGSAYRSVDSGATWLPVVTNAPGYLRGVVYDGHQFIVCGGQHTILASTDGMTFHVRSLSYSVDLEAVAFSADGYLLAGGFGASGFAAESRDPRYWILDGPPAGSSYLRAAGFAWGTSVLTGQTSDGSALIFSRRPGGVWAADMTGPGHSLNAVASSPTIAVAVGNAGTILRTVQNPSELAVEIVSSPSVALAGDRVVIRARVAGSTAVHYRWFHDGALVAGAGDAQLVIPAAQASDAGTYKAEVSAGALVRTAEYVFKVIPLGALAEVLDSSFSVDVPAEAPRIGSLPDGRIWVLNPSQPLYVNDEPVSPVAFVNPDGTLSAPPGPQSPLFNTIDGYPPTNPPTILLQDARYVRATVSIDYNQIALTRWLEDGTQDQSYGTHIVSVPGLRSSIQFPGTTFTAAVATHDDTGNWLVGVVSHQSVGTGIFGDNLTVTLKVDRDGVPLADWTPGLVPRAIVQLAAAGEGYRFLATEQNGGLGSNHLLVLGAITAAGAPDPTFPDQVFTKTGYEARLFDAPAATLGPDGSAYIALSGYIVRYDPAGRRDPAYYAPTGTVDENLSSIARQPDGRLILAGGVGTDPRVVADQPRIWRITPIANEPPTRLANLSIRTTAGSGDRTLIAGFVTAGGNGQRALLMRAIGPGLADVGLNSATVVSDPHLTLYSGSIATRSNDNWDSTLSSTFTRLGAFPLGSGSKDAALLATVGPGAYTAHVGSADGSAGLALLELYDAGSNSGTDVPRLVNISGRAYVNSGDGVLIAGFVVAGKVPIRLLVRGIGPGLAKQNVADVLARPVLEIRNGSTVIAQNTAWSDALTADDFTKVGAFALDPKSHDTAILQDFTPGVYTATVRSENDTTGTALIEIYEVP